MARIPMPPPVALADRTHTDHYPATEQIYFDFGATGYFSRVEDAKFNPDFPMGLFYKGSSIGPFVAGSSSTSVDLVFIDQSTGLAYIETVKIP